VRGRQLTAWAIAQPMPLALLCMLCFWVGILGWHFLLLKFYLDILNHSLHHCVQMALWWIQGER
jgi:hypothetical protein